MGGAFASALRDWQHKDASAPSDWQHKDASAPRDWQHKDASALRDWQHKDASALRYERQLGVRSRTEPVQISRNPWQAAVFAA